MELDETFSLYQRLGPAMFGASQVLVLLAKATEQNQTLNFWLNATAQALFWLAVPANTMNIINFGRNVLEQRNRNH